MGQTRISSLGCFRDYPSGSCVWCEPPNWRGSSALRMGDTALHHPVSFKTAVPKSMLYTLPSICFSFAVRASSLWRIVLPVVSLFSRNFWRTISAWEGESNSQQYLCRENADKWQLIWASSGPTLRCLDWTTDGRLGELHAFVLPMCWDSGTTTYFFLFQFWILKQSFMIFPKLSFIAKMPILVLNFESCYWNYSCFNHFTCHSQDLQFIAKRCVEFWYLNLGESFYFYFSCIP